MDSLVSEIGPAAIQLNSLQSLEIANWRRTPTFHKPPPWNSERVYHSQSWLQTNSRRQQASHVRSRLHGQNDGRTRPGDLSVIGTAM